MDVPAGWTATTVRANGVDLQCYRAGSGPPLVVAHGFYENGRCRAPLVSDLADDFAVVAYDARGHGRSDAPASGYALPDRVADLVGVVDALDLADPVLFGHSMGGSTVAWTAANHPDLPRAVALEDPAAWQSDPGTGPEERVQVVRDRVADWAERSVADLASDQDDRDPDLARRIAVANTECSPHVAEIARHGYPPTPDAFPDVECPALVLKADADPETRAAHLDDAEALPDGRLVHVPRAGHAVFRDEYDAAAAELRAFLERVRDA